MTNRMVLREALQHALPKRGKFDCLVNSQIVVDLFEGRRTLEGGHPLLGIQRTKTFVAVNVCNQKKAILRNH